MKIIREAQSQDVVYIELWGGPKGKASFPLPDQGLGNGADHDAACHKINNLVNQGGGNIVRSWNDVPIPEETQADWQTQQTGM